MPTRPGDRSSRLLRLLAMVAALAVFRLGCVVLLPGVDAAVFRKAR